MCGYGLYAVRCTSGTARSANTSETEGARCAHCRAQHVCLSFNHATRHQPAAMRVRTEGSLPTNSNTFLGSSRLTAFQQVPDANLLRVRKRRLQCAPTTPRPRPLLMLLGLIYSYTTEGTTLPRANEPLSVNNNADLHSTHAHGGS